MTAWMANVVATGVGTGPSYVLNRRWVWAQRGASHPWREVAPFWGMSFAGLALSTAAVAVADAWAASAGLTGAARSVALLLANAAAFGSLWVGQFLVLDRVLFGGRAVQRSRVERSLLACRAVVDPRRPPSAPPKTWSARRVRGCIPCVNRRR